LFSAHFHLRNACCRPQKIAAVHARTSDYSRFPGAIEAQSLCAVLPLIRAHRPKLPHLVYEIPNYRMQNVSRSPLIG
jgi:hypothetical protein